MHLKLLSIIWLVAVVTGSAALSQYKRQAGEVGETPRQWPSDSGVQRPTSGAVLVIAVHPRCGCTEASVSELARLLGRVGGAVVHTIELVVDPDPEWETSSLRGRLAAIAGVALVADHGGVEARRFGAETSGHTLLFADDGTLKYSGGITASRGHEGDNAGALSIVDALNGLVPVTQGAPVFGCDLVSTPKERI